MSRARSTRRSILVHHCFNPFLRDKSNRLWFDAETHECSCRQHITLVDALAYVHDDMALFCSIPTKGPILLSQRPEGYRAIVKMGKGHKGPAHTISKNDIERAYVEEQRKAQRHVELYGAATQAMFVRLGACWRAVSAPGKSVAVA